MMKIFMEKLYRELRFSMIYFILTYESITKNSQEFVIEIMIKTFKYRILFKN